MDYFFTNNKQSFRDLVLGEDTYIDKTSFISALYKHHSTFEMLLRPHGFGKTILIDTIFHMFHNFNDAFMDHLDFKQQSVTLPPHHIIKLDFNTAVHTGSDFQDYLFNFYRARSFEFSLESDIIKSFSIYRQTVLFIKSLADKSPTGKVIILIDNYDAEILANLAYPNVVKPLYEAMLEFYHALADSAEYIDWCLITGETKFNLTNELQEGIAYINDITYIDRTTIIFGFPNGEMKKYYLDFLEDEADATDRSVEEFIDLISEWYGNYRFNNHNIRVFRPASILSYLSARDQHQFKSYYSFDHVRNFLPYLLQQYGRQHEKLLIPNDCGYSFAEYNSLDNIKMFALLSQMGIYSFHHIEVDTNDNHAVYTYFSSITNRETNDLYLQALAMVKNDPPPQ